MTDFVRQRPDFSERELDDNLKREMFFHTTQTTFVSQHSTPEPAGALPFPPKSDLFTNDDDFVNFNNLDLFDYLTWDYYDASGGDDLVILPKDQATAWDIDYNPFNDFHGGYGNDAIFGGKSFDHIYGDAGNDYIFGGESMDYLDGGTGNDTLDGGDANDSLNGYTGNDDLKGGSGNDKLFGGNGDDVLDGGSGNDRLYGDASADDFFPEQSQGIGNDKLVGGNGNDQLYGGNGDDTLLGGDGDDLLNGGHGGDVMTGGAGKDIFYLAVSDFADLITDFKDGIDLLYLSDGLTFNELKIENFGSGCLISVKGTSEYLAIIQNGAGKIGAEDFF